ncbi:MAG: beta-propeller fold lactonase family protein [Acidobacteriaceae bacterium]
MTTTYVRVAAFGLGTLLAVGCGGNSTITPPPISPSCVASSTPEFAYTLDPDTGAGDGGAAYAVSMYSVNSCTGALTSTSPASVTTGIMPPNLGAEEMVADPLGRFAYVANLVSNATDEATISMYTVNSGTGILTSTAPATVPTGFFPQEIAIDPLGRFVYTANSDDNSISMFTINQSTGVLTPTSPATVSTVVPGNILWQPNFLTVDPTGRFLYLTESLTNDAAVLMFNIDQTTGVLTPTSPATIGVGGWPWQVVITPSDKFAYVVNNLTGSDGSFGVFQFTVNSTTGVLTPNNPAFVASGNGPTEIAVDPTSKFAYVVNRQDNTLSMYTIDPGTGNLTLNTARANATGTIATGDEPFRALFDLSGKFLYVANENGPASIYTVNNDGTLTAVGSTASSSLAIAFATPK